MNRTFFYISLFVLSLVSPPLFSQNEADFKLKTIVIDPGHGGQDPGSISKDGKLYEKDVVLPISLSLGAMIKEKYPDIKVIYTRSTDKFIPLHERSAIANRNNADLFISVHINSTTSSSPRGTETYVMGMDRSNSNLEVCLKENNVVVLEEDYTSKYEGYDPNNPESFIIFSLLQNSHLEQSLIFASMVEKNLKNNPFKVSRGIKQGTILVLWKCTMPAVLVELGFISNYSEARELSNKETRNKLAKSLFHAFEEYKEQYEKKVILPATPPPSATSPTPRYSIQIMASSRVLEGKAPEFKGLECTCIKSGNLYKYVTGQYASKKEAEKALEQVRTKFPQAYIISIE